MDSGENTNEQEVDWVREERERWKWSFVGSMSGGSMSKGETPGAGGCEVPPVGRSFQW